MTPAPNQRLKDELAEVIGDRRVEVRLAQRRLNGAELALLMVTDWPRKKLGQAIVLLGGPGRSMTPRWAHGLYDADGYMTPEAKEALALLRELLTPDPKEDR